MNNALNVMKVVRKFITIILTTGLLASSQPSWAISIHPGESRSYSPSLIRNQALVLPLISMRKKDSLEGVTPWKKTLGLRLSKKKSDPFVQTTFVTIMGILLDLATKSVVSRALPLQVIGTDDIPATGPLFFVTHWIFPKHLLGIAHGQHVITTPTPFVLVFALASIGLGSLFYLFRKGHSIPRWGIGFLKPTFFFVWECHYYHKFRAGS